MEAERYNRQIILKGFGKLGQLRLAKARVLVIGAGGLGCPALQYLAAAGVGHLALADDDTISLSNLHRQVLFSSHETGMPKADIAANRLREMNPQITIVAHRIKIRQNNALDLLNGYDIILDGTDNFESRYLINDVCALLDKPLVFAAVSGYEGQLAVFNMKDDVGRQCNYRDIFPVPPAPGEVPNCAENGVLGVLPGVIGTMAAAEVIKIITGIGTPFINKLLHYNLLTCSQYIINILPGTDYALPKTEKEFLHTKYSDMLIREIDLEVMQHIMQIPSTIMIDVRERHEVPVLNNTIFIQVPMSEFSAFLETDVNSEHIVLVCQHGIRSMAAAKALNKKYGNAKKLYSLKGGIAQYMNHFKSTQ